MPKVNDLGEIVPMTRPFAFHQSSPPRRSSFIGGGLPQIELGPQTLLGLERLAQAMERLAGHRTNIQPCASIPNSGTVSASVLEHVAIVLDKIGDDHQRIADHFDPQPADVVGTPYLAKNSPARPPGLLRW